MVRIRRFQTILSIVLLAAGASLLIYAAARWIVPQKPPFAGQPAEAPDRALLDLPPALAPAPLKAEESQLSAPDMPGETGAAPLLPESPLAALEETADQKDDAGAAPSSSTSDPKRIIIPALGIDGPVYRAGLESKEDGQREYQQWSVPDAYAAGWHESSAPLGQVGNTVLNGHNNVHGGIFSELAQLAVGEQIILSGDEGAVVYRVIHHELLQERGLSLRERLRNARWIAETADERLTLVTCWPNTTNSHRLIVVAEPAGDSEAGSPEAAIKRRTDHDSY